MPDAALNEKYKEYLLTGENVKGVYQLGIIIKPYKVITTEKRLIIIKKFPKNLIEVDYNSIELIEYYTNVEWLKLFYSIPLYILLWLLYQNKELILTEAGKFIPPLDPILHGGNFFGMNAGTFILTGTLFVAGTYFLGIFVLSLFGRLRVLLYDQAPIDMITGLTPEIENLLKCFEETKVRSSSGTAVPQPPTQAQPAQPTQPTPPAQPAQPAQPKTEQPSQQASPQPTEPKAEKPVEPKTEPAQPNKPT